MSFYQRDCLDLVAEGLASDKVFADIATLVLLSIQQPWQGMAAQFAHVRQHGRDSVYLFGAKRAGYDYVQEHVRDLRTHAQIARDTGDLDGLLVRYLQIPCLGLVKASFLAQMTMGDGACLDLHNLRRLGLNANDVRLPKATATERLIAAKISAYNSTWRAHGNTEYWWNTWCENMVGTTYNKRLTSADQVSALHRLPLE